MGDIAQNTVFRGSANVLLEPEIATEVWAKTLQTSAVMQLGSRVTVTGAGKEWQTINGEPEAYWVGELNKKPNSIPSFGTKKMRAYTISVIVPFSNQFRRDKPGLYNEIIARTPNAIARTFDKTVFGQIDAPGENFDTMKDIATVDIESKDKWDALVDVDEKITDADGILNGWVISPKMKSALLRVKDTTGYPVYVNSVTGSNGIPYLMGQPTYLRKDLYVPPVTDGEKKAATLGFGGDWSSLFYGMVEDIQFSITDQATITIDGEQVNLWENNMFAVRFECDMGAVMKYPDQFVRITGATPA